MREWLKEARKNKGLTMKQMGAELGVSESCYCYIEKGLRHKTMNIVLATKISKALDVPLDYIVKQETI